MSSDGDPMEAAEPVAGVPRVLFLDQSAELGGAEMMLLDLVSAWPGVCEVVVLADGPFAQRLRSMGVATRVVPLGGGAAEVRKGGSRLRLVRAAPSVARCATRVARIARRYDVIYANTAKALVIGTLAGRLARRPVVFHLHDLVTASHFSVATRKVLVALSNRAAAVVANSQASADALRQAGGKPRRLTVVYNGFRIDGWAGSADVPIRSAPEGPLRLGLFGRLTAWKGQHVAIEALGQLPPDSATLCLVGDALYGSEDQAYAGALRQRAEELGLSDRVHFLGQRDEVPALMRACDVVLHTSTSPEPFGRVIVEGMLCGKPVIATDGGGVREIMDDGVTGLIVPPGDAGALAAAIGRLLGDAAFAARLAAAGRSSAAERFTVGQMVTGVQKAVAAAWRSDVRPAHPR